MKEQFASYEISLKLKELGFDEPCLAMFNLEHNLRFIKNKTGYPNGSRNSECEPNVLAPLWQQVIDWLREKHSIVVRHELAKDMWCSYSILKENFKWAVIKVDDNSTTDALKYTLMEGKSFNSYYEAREQAILKAIKLIK